MTILLARTVMAASILLGVPAAAVAAAVAQESASFTGAAVSDADLGTVTGRADTAMIIRAENTSTVAGNSVIGESTTGGISFEPQTLQNLSGLSLLSANTGNNVAINSSLNLNVAIHP